MKNALLNIKTINWNAIAGIIRAVGPTLCTLLVGYSLLPKEIADQLPEQLAQLTLAVGTVSTLAAGIWSLFSNKATSVAKQAASVSGIMIVATDAAPEGVKQLAEDPKQPDIVKGAA